MYKKIKLTYTNTFIFAMCILFFAFVVGLLHNPQGSQRQIFSLGLEDFFGDFFNNLRYIAERDPYYNTINGYGEKAYLPLTYLILYPFSKLDRFNTMSLPEALNSKIGLMSVFIYSGVHIFLFLFALRGLCKKYHISNTVLIGLVLSYVFFFTIERGNTIMMSGALLAYFLTYYNSDNKNERLMAVFFLALLAVLKVYPVLFGFLYFEKKQFKEIFLSAILAILFAFLPFLFFKRGFDNIPQLVHNAMLNNHFYRPSTIFPRFSFAHLVFIITEHYRLMRIAMAANVLLSVSSIALSFFVKNKWIKVSLLSLTVLFLPISSILYCGVYVFPIIILFFATTQERSKIFNLFTLLMFIILLNPFQLSTIKLYDDDLHVNDIAANVSMLTLWFVLLIVSGKDVLNSLKRKTTTCQTDSV